MRSSARDVEISYKNLLKFIKKMTIVFPQKRGFSVIIEIFQSVEKLIQEYELEINKDRFNRWTIAFNLKQKEVPLEKIDVPDHVPPELKTLVEQSLRIKKDYLKDEIIANAYHLMRKLKITKQKADEIMQYLK